MLLDRTPIWRYFDFAKFVHLLETRTLFFPSASQLDDPFEGAIPQKNADPRAPARSRGGAARERETALRRDLTAISSWHINTDESFAMWRIYTRSPEAIAIRTTIGGLRRALEAERGHEVQVGKVEYIDYARDRLAPRAKRGLSPFLCKAKPYSYENEVRAIVDLHRRYRARGRDEAISAALRERGVPIRVDLEPLLEQVHVSPNAGGWFLDLVRGILKRYDLRIQPCQSVLAAWPAKLPADLAAGSPPRRRPAGRRRLRA